MEKEVWTVVGYWDESGQSFVQTVLAHDGEEAILVAADEFGEGSDDCCIVAAFRGDLEPVFPCESGAVAYASDLV